MARITLQVLEGMERGRTFGDLPTPVTIGREDENSIRLNDERVSRFHAKIQEDGGSIILTDLESTNGTRVNGHPVQMRVLQIGDLLLIGRCLLVYGSADEIAQHNAQLSVEEAGDVREASPQSAGTELPRAHRSNPKKADESFDDEEIPLFAHGPPPLPQSLFPVQRAQVSDVLAYLHDELRTVLEAAQEGGSAEDRRSKTISRPMTIDVPDWQRLLRLEMDLAVYLRQIVEPER